MRRNAARFLSACCAALMAVSPLATGVSAESKGFDKPEDGVMYWAGKFGGDKLDDWGWPMNYPGNIGLGTETDKNGESYTYVYFYVEDVLYKLDGYTGETVAQGKMAGTVSYSTKGPVIADGKVFVALDGGKIQAFDAKTLESLWIYTNKNGGGADCDILYSDGAVYTGFWNGDEADADYVCVDVTTDDETSTDEEHFARWTYTHKGGFYWSGAAVNDGVAVFGTEDGAAYGKEGQADVVAVDAATGEIKNDIRLDKDSGDVRSKTVIDDGRFFFTTTGGKVCVLNGISGSVTTLDLGKLLAEKGYQGLACTSTPIVLGGRIYVAMNGAGYGDFGGSGIAVLTMEADESVGGKVNSLELAYYVETTGKCQADGIFMGVDDEGYNVIYYVENNANGSIRVLRDKAGMTEPLTTVDETETLYDENYQKTGEVTHKCLPAIFKFGNDYKQYCTTSPQFDKESGIIYLRNDSCNIMAIGAKPTVSLESDNIIHAGKTKTLVVKPGMKINDLKAEVSVDGGITGVTTDEELVFSIDEFTTADEVLTVSQKFKAVADGTGSNSNITASEDLALLVAETDDQYKRALADRGDVDGSGTVDVTDIAMTASHIKGIKAVDKYSVNAADVNNDGDINVTDIAMQAAHIKGLKAIDTAK